ncbi:uncharacterized protein LOC111359283 [Spodoptera litura]|uniref:Uncharacterized protein LOC111359283 n=1 Tax=Spodoptera litura TaxID=69820 RepID=A0A9J7IZD3_SPOLT|nr:uncharacterized protein LOC111359283 [Spodoptera litura]
MARTHLAFTLLILAVLEVEVTLGDNHAKHAVNAKRRNEIVEETFLEQKDILLNMLESKLKEVRDKKKKKDDIEGHANCNRTLENVDVKLKVNGISAIGDANVALKYGTGKGSINLEGDGIFNIGKVQMALGVGETFQIPGLNGLFIDIGHKNCTIHTIVAPNEGVANNNTRRSENETTNPKSAPNTADNVHGNLTSTAEAITVENKTLLSLKIGSSKSTLVTSAI